MHHKMILRIKNWKLTLLGLLFICLFTALGLWQVARAKQKTELLEMYALRTQAKSLTASDLNQPRDSRFFTVSLQGEFDNHHTFLLDNKTFHGQVGYEVYTPFHAYGLAQPLLIDRGFIPLGKSRLILPTIPVISGVVTLTGLINLPPHYSTFPEMHDKSLAWPLRIQFLDIDRISQLLNQQIAPYVINIDPKHKAALAIEWQIVIMSPERHMGYAVQWFALALTLLILSVALNQRAR